MKTVWKTLGIIFGVLIVLLLVLRITGLNPRDRTPGLWLTGNSRHCTCCRLVVHGQISHCKASDSHLVFASALGND